MRANHNMGLAHQSIGDAGSAIAFHERHLSLAVEKGVDAERTTANVELVKVYRACAENKEAQGDYRGAVQFHEKCLRVSACVRACVSK